MVVAVALSFDMAGAESYVILDPDAHSVVKTYELSNS